MMTLKEPASALSTTTRGSRLFFPQKEEREHRPATKSRGEKSRGLHSVRKTSGGNASPKAQKRPLKFRRNAAQNTKPNVLQLVQENAKLDIASIVANGDYGESSDRSNTTYCPSTILSETNSARRDNYTNRSDVSSQYSETSALEFDSGAAPNSQECITLEQMYPNKIDWRNQNININQRDMKMTLHSCRKEVQSVVLRLKAFKDQSQRGRVGEHDVMEYVQLIECKERLKVLNLLKTLLSEGATNWEDYKNARDHFVRENRGALEDPVQMCRFDAEFRRWRMRQQTLAERQRKNFEAHGNVDIVQVAQSFTKGDETQDEVNKLSEEVHRWKLRFLGESGESCPRTSPMKVMRSTPTRPPKATRPETGVVEETSSFFQTEILSDEGDYSDDDVVIHSARTVISETASEPRSESARSGEIHPHAPSHRRQPSFVRHPRVRGFAMTPVIDTAESNFSIGARDGSRTYIGDEDEDEVLIGEADDSEVIPDETDVMDTEGAVKGGHEKIMLSQLEETFGSNSVVLYDMEDEDGFDEHAHGHERDCGRRASASPCFSSPSTPRIGQEGSRRSVFLEGSSVTRLSPAALFEDPAEASPAPSASASASPIPERLDQGAAESEDAESSPLSRDSLGEARSPPCLKEDEGQAVSPFVPVTISQQKSSASVGSTSAEGTQDTPPQPQFLMSASNNKRFIEVVVVDPQSNGGDEKGAVAKIAIEKLLGKGSSAKVFLGRLRTETSDDLFAVKQLGLAGTKKSMHKLLCIEVDMLKQFNHPNIVSYRGMNFSKSLKEYYILLEYVDGGSLSSLLTSRRSVGGGYTEGMVGFLVKQVLQGLSYLHSKNVIHRDLKPANILLTTEGGLKITDFGVATQLVELRTLRRSCVGTPHYLAPEVISVEPYGFPADIWSVGCCVLELATGKRPYGNMNAIAAMFRMVNDAHPPIPADLSDDLQAFLRGCFCRNPKERPTAEELLSSPFVQHNSVTPDEARAELFRSNPEGTSEEDE